MHSKTFFYQVGGVSIPPLLAREKQVGLISGRLVQKHVCVVGPKNFGKSVLLYGLAAQLLRSGAFTACLYWDLRHHIPDSDAEFYATFAKEIAKQLKSKTDDLKTFLSDCSKFEPIHYVFEDQHDQGERVLLILDGMDDTLEGGSLTKNVWDNLRSLSDIPTLRFATGSRQPLRTLCACKESKSSDFWNIFHPEPIRLGAFEDNDWEKFTTPLNESDITLNGGALSQLKRWTGGCPLLSAAMCAHALESRLNGVITSDQINELAASVETIYRPFIDDLWDDCRSLLQGYIIEVCAAGTYEASKVPAADAEELQLRGYISQNREGIRCSNQFLENCSKRSGHILPDIRRLFGEPDSFDRNIKTLLEVRLEQVSGGDRELTDYVSLAIQELGRPHVSIAQVRNISARALKLIWDVELKDRTIPKEWTNKWKFDGVMAPPSGKLRSDEGGQLQVLNLLTDDRKSVPAKATERSTFCLVSFLHSVGNLGQHRRSVVSAGFAASVCFAAIQLVEELSRLSGRKKVSA
jgi:hypothetical protein